MQVSVFNSEENTYYVLLYFFLCISFGVYHVPDLPVFRNSMVQFLERINLLFPGYMEAEMDPGFYRNLCRILTNLPVFSHTHLPCLWQYLGLTILEPCWGSMLWISLVNLSVNPKVSAFSALVNQLSVLNLTIFINIFCLLVPPLHLGGLIPILFLY